MIPRFSALACAAILGILLPGATTIAQEVPAGAGLFLSPEDPPVDYYNDFGRSVAIAGRTAFVGDPYLGRVALYTQDEDGAWPRTGTLLPDNPVPGEGEFAESMAAHGKRLALRSGNVIRLYEQHGSEWQPQSIVRVPGPWVGLNPPLAYDGETLVLQRKQYETDPVTGLQTTRGIVVVYRIGRHGEATLVRALWGPIGREFGEALAVRGDRLVVAGNSDGAAYVYWNDHGYWRSEQKLTLTGPTVTGGIGAVAIHGRHILAGAPDDEPIPTWDGDLGVPPTPPISGAVYVFTKSQGRWRQTQRVRPDRNEFSGFGGTIAAGGKRVAIGAPIALDNDNGLLGETYVYRWDGDTLVFDYHPSQQSGTSLGMTARRLIVGRWTFDSHGNSVSGAAVFDFGDRDPNDNVDADD